MDEVDLLKLEAKYALRELNEKFPLRKQARLYLIMLTAIEKVEDVRTKHALKLFLLFYKLGCVDPQKMRALMSMDDEYIKLFYEEKESQFRQAWYEAEIAYKKALKKRE